MTTSKLLLDTMQINFAIITTPEQLHSWADAVNRTTTANKVGTEIMCGLQDIFGKSRGEDIQKCFLQLHSDKKMTAFRMVIFSVGKAMGVDVQLDLLNIYANFKADYYLKAEYEARMKEVDEKETELVAKSVELSNKEQEYKNKIEKLNSENANLRFRIQNVNEANVKLSSKVDELNELIPDAEHFRMMKIIFKELAK